MPLLCGGTTEEKDATEEVQKICDEVAVCFRSLVGVWGSQHAPLSEVDA